MESKNLMQELTLKEFVEKEKDLLTMVNIFAALCLFAKEFVSGVLGETISFLFFSAFVLLWFELWKNFPKGGSFSLRRFKDISVFIGFAIIFYWLGRAWLLSKGYFIFILWIFTVELLGPPLFEKVISKLLKGIKRENLQYFIKYFFALSFLCIVLLVITTLTNKFSFFFDNLFRGYIK
jgi:hypothetical protein